MFSLFSLGKEIPIFCERRTGLKQLICAEELRSIAYTLLFSVFAVNKRLTRKFLNTERGSYIVTVGIDIPDDMEEEYDEWMRKQVSYSPHCTSFT